MKAMKTNVDEALSLIEELNINELKERYEEDRS